MRRQVACGRRCGVRGPCARRLFGKHHTLPPDLRPALDRRARNFAVAPRARWAAVRPASRRRVGRHRARSEEHTSELQSLMRISYAVFCLKKKKKKNKLI